MYSHRPLRSLVLAVALSAAVYPTTYALTAESHDPTLTEALTKEVVAQIKIEVAPAIKEAVQTAKDQALVAKATSVKSESVNAEPAKQETTRPSAGSRIADTGADAFAFMVERAKSYTGRIEDGVSKAVDIAMVEIPETLKQYLKWKALYHGVYGLASPLIALVALIVGVVAFRKIDRNSNDSPVPVILVVPSALILFVCFLAFFAGPGGGSGMSGLDHCLKFAQIMIAPRVFLIEELTKLVR